MKKYKFLIALLIIPLVVSACSCSKRDDNAKRVNLEIKQREDVADEVENWVVYTNPAYRYELRSPRDWDILDVEKKGEEVMFYPEGKTISDEYKGELRILGFSNWKDEYSIDEYVKNHAETNYYALSRADEREEFEYRGFYAQRFRNVELSDGRVIDVIAVDARDRIILIEMYGEYGMVETIIGSMYFY